MGLFDGFELSALLDGLINYTMSSTSTAASDTDTPSMTEAHMKTLAHLIGELKPSMTEAHLKRFADLMAASTEPVDNILNIVTKILEEERGGVEAAVDTNDPGTEMNEGE